MDVDALRAQLRRDKEEGCNPISVVASAGTVNTGAIDPLGEILEVGREEYVWLHVDGAYGGFGLLDPTIAHLYEGFAEADSIAVDPHKRRVRRREKQVLRCHEGRKSWVLK